MDKAITPYDALQTLLDMAGDDECWFQLARDGERFLAHDEGSPDEVFVVRPWGLEPQPAQGWPAAGTRWSVAPSGDVITPRG